MQWAKIPNTLSKRQERVTARARTHSAEREQNRKKPKNVCKKPSIQRDPKKQAQTNEAVKMFNKGRSDD